LTKGDLSNIGSSLTKFEVEKFNGKKNFNLWQKTVKALLVQQGLHKTFQEKSAKPAGTSNEDWEGMNQTTTNTLHYVSQTRLCTM